MHRLDSMKHDKGLVEISIDALVMAHTVRDDQSSCGAGFHNDVSRH